MSSHIKDNTSVGRKIGMVLTYIVLIFFAIMAIAPLAWLIMNSFKTSQDYQTNRLGLPKMFSGRTIEILGREDTSAHIL